MPVNGTDNIFSMIMESGVVVQMVLLLLIFFSLLSWTIIFVKIRRFRQAKCLNEDFEDMFWETQNLGQVYTQAKRMNEAPMAGVFLAGYNELRRLQESVKNRDATPDSRVWIESLERSLNKGIQEEITSIEYALPFLATVARLAEPARPML